MCSVVTYIEHQEPVDCCVADRNPNSDPAKCDSPASYRMYDELGDDGKRRHTVQQIADEFDAPASQLLVRLQDAKNGEFFGEQKAVNTGKASSILVSEVLAGTQFHVCAASPTGSPGGPYDADLSY